MIVTVVLLVNGDNVINFIGERLSDVNFKIVESKTIKNNK